MKNKKIISSALALLTVFALASCGNNDNGGNGSGSNRPNVGDNGTINVMLLDTGIGTDFLNEVADDFYNETGITVRVNSDSLIDEDLKNSMTLEDGVDDDIYMSGLTYNWIDWVNADTIEDLTDLCNEEYDDGSTINGKIAPAIRDLGKIGDHRFIIQFTYCPTGFVYNQDMLDDLYEKGVAESNVFPTEWDKLVKLAKDVSAADYKYNGSKTYGIVWGATDEDPMDTYKTLWAQGDYSKYREYFVQEEELDVNRFVNDENRKALEALYDLFAPVNGVSSTSVPRMLTTSHTDGYNSFLRGDALMCFAGGWFESEVKENISEDTFNYRFAPVPALGGNEICVNVNYPTEYFFIPKCSKNVEKAKRFLKFMFREENLVKMHNAVQTPLAFDYDTSSLKLTDWGKEVQSVMKYKQTVSGSTSLYYLTGGLRPEITGNVFQKIYNGQVARDNLASLLRTDFDNKSGGNWEDTKGLVVKYEEKFRSKGLIK